MRHGSPTLAHVAQMAPETKVWTLEELHSLPDDGNKYELIQT